MTQSPLFAVLLTPHRSLSPQGIRFVVAFTAIMASIPGIAFFAMGAWPVVGLLGFDVVLLTWALTASYADKDAFEEITLWPDALDIRRVNRKGRETSFSFNPFAVRFSVVRDGEDRVIALKIETRDGEVEIGKFLTPDDKASFAEMFAPALHRAKA
ncbi:DUF2244 domain-containing protein [Pelagibacterium sp. 26DY04]|uniref:DUF2244 domain-containing protein n=1 Tax=Pelagibacterium sp. 26DY04 TaxID=2967130 RepID=UPI0028157BF1|nr:DUF2244 domain-containing protein [Pelagibacterium sp. 26DY04]WMT87005.1 DUF2244 domain-containing protein [Pelagibacterium sp. 26DY04]